MKSNSGKNTSKRSNKVKLSIVIPVFNEERNLELLVNKYKNFKNPYLEVLFVEDGGSKDNTRKELTGLSKKYKFVKPVFTKNRGYGASIFAGLKKAKGEYICWTHGDIQTPPKDTIKAYKIANNRKNILVKGNRKGRPFTDSFFTAGMSVFEFLILGKIFRDINAQPNLFHKSFLKQIKNPPKDFAFDLFIYHLAKKLNYKIIRFPVTFEDRIHGESSWNKNIFAKWKFIKRTMKFSLELRKKL